MTRVQRLLPGTATVKPSTTPTPTSIQPTQSGLINNCTDFYFAVANEHRDLIVAKYATFTYKDFVRWNPAVGPACGSIQAQSYMLHGSILPSRTGLSRVAPLGAGVGAGVGVGTLKSRTDAWWMHLVCKDDTCATFVKKCGTFSRTQFLRGNPSVGSDCKGLWLDTWFCVGVSGRDTVMTRSIRHVRRA
jgi:hypothetical protein